MADGSTAPPRAPGVTPSGATFRRRSPAASGILDGRRATTNPGALDDLCSYGTIDVIEARVVDDGDILTAGAPVCGVDLALGLLERYGGPGLAEAGAREIGYERPAVAVA